MRDSAGVIITENGAQEPAITLGSRLNRIGSIDDADALYRVRHVQLMADGSVALVEQSSGTVQFFDDLGRKTDEFGGIGEGPGEFRGLGLVLETDSDTIVAVDQMYPGSLSIFGPDGSFVRSARLPRVGQGEIDIVGGWWNGDLVVLRQSVAEGTGPGDTLEYGLYTVTMAGAVGLDLGLWPMGVFRTGYIAFGHRASLAAAGRQLVYTPGDRFEVRVFSVDGKLERISRVRRPRHAVTQADIDTYLREEWEPAVARAAGTALARRMREIGDPIFPDSLPAYTDVLANRTGGYWAKRATRPRDPSNVWDVFDEDGVLIGALALPPRFQPMALRFRRVAGVWLDANDVEYVDVYEW